MSDQGTITEQEYLDHLDREKQQDAQARAPRGTFNARGALSRAEEAAPAGPEMPKDTEAPNLSIESPVAMPGIDMSSFIERPENQRPVPENIGPGTSGPPPLRFERRSRPATPSATVRDINSNVERLESQLQIFDDIDEEIQNRRPNLFQRITGRHIGADPQRARAAAYLSHVFHPEFEGFHQGVPILQMDTDGPHFEDPEKKIIDIFHNLDDYSMELFGTPYQPNMVDKIRAHWQSGILQERKHAIYDQAYMQNRPLNSSELEELQRIQMQMPDPALMQTTFQEKLLATPVSQIPKLMTSFGEAAEKYGLPVAGAAMTAFIVLGILTKGTSFFQGAGLTGTTSVAGLGIKGGSTALTTMGSAAITTVKGAAGGALMVGQTEASMRRYRSSAIEQLMDIQDAGGNRIPLEQVYMFATIHSTASAALEMFAVKSAFGLIPGFRDLLNQGASQALIKGSYERILLHHIGKYGSNMLVQGSTEVGQHFSAAIIREAAVAQFNNENAHEMANLAARFEQGINAFHAEGVEPPQEWIDMMKAEFDEVEKQVGFIQHEWETLVPDLQEAFAGGIAMAITFGTVGAGLSLNTDLHNAATFRSQSGAANNIYGSLYTESGAQRRNEAGVKRLIEAYEEVAPLLNEEQKAAFQRIVGDQDAVLNEHFESFVDDIKNVAREDGGVTLNTDTNPINLSQAVEGTRARNDILAGENMVSQREAGPFSEILARMLDDHIDGTRDTPAINYGMQFDSLEQSRQMQKNSYTRVQDERTLQQTKLRREPTHGAFTNFGQMLDSVSDNSIRSNIRAREMQRIFTLPIEAKMRPDVMALMVDLEMINNQGQYISDTLDVMGPVRQNVYTNSLDRAYIPGYFEANAFALAAHYNVPIQVADTVSQKIQEQAAKHPNAGLQIAEDFADYQRVRRNLRDRVELNESTVVHYKMENFPQFAAQRSRFMSDSAIIDQYNKQFVNLVNIYTELKDIPTIQFNIEMDGQMVPDRRLAFRATERFFKNYLRQKEEQAGRMTPNAIAEMVWLRKNQTQAINEAMDGFRAIVQNNVPLRGDILDTIISENLHQIDHIVNKSAYILNEPLTQADLEAARPQIEALQDIRMRQESSRLRQQAVEGVTTPQALATFGEAFDNVFQERFRKVEGQDFIANQKAFNLNERVIKEIDAQYFYSKKKPKKAKLDQERADINMAMALWIEMEGMDSFDIDMKLRSLAGDGIRVDQRRQIKLARNLPQWAIDIATEIKTEFNTILEQGQKNNILHQGIENYTVHRWMAEGITLTDPAPTSFQQTTASAEHRNINTIMDGWIGGKKLKHEGLLDSYVAYHSEIQSAIANRQMIDSGLKILTMRNKPMFRLNQEAGYVEVKLDNFYKLQPFEHMTKEQYSELGSTGDYTLIGDQVYIKNHIYAHRDIAKMLEFALGPELGSKDTMGSTVWRGFQMWSNLRKQMKLVSNFFHPMAYLRSYYFPTPGFKEGKRLSPKRAVAEGLAALHASMDANVESVELVRLLVQEGMTVNMRQDFHHVMNKRNGNLSRMAENKTFSIAATDKVKNVMGAMHHWTFDQLGAGLKTSAAILEMQHWMKKNPTGDPQVAARRIALLINDDFGGLNLRREARNPYIQAVFRAAVMAPDWTESNVRTMLRVFDHRVDAETRKSYRQFWARSMTRNFAGLAIGNMMLAAAFGEEDMFSELMKNWESVIKQVGANAGDWRYTRRALLKLFEIDLTPLWSQMAKSDANIEIRNTLGIETFKLDPDQRKYFRFGGHFNDLMKFTMHPLQSANGKLSLGYQDIINATSGRVWNGQEFRDWNDMFADIDNVWDIFDPGSYTRWGAGGSSPIDLFSGTAFAWMAYTIMSSFPQQKDQMINMGKGREDVVTSILNGLGVGLTSARPWNPSRRRQGRTGSGSLSDY